MAALPSITRPTRQVSPTTRPARLRMALMRWRVWSIPERLSASKAPTCHRKPEGAIGQHKDNIEEASRPCSHARPVASYTCCLSSLTHLLHGLFKVLCCHRQGAELDFPIGESGEGRSPQIHDNLHQLHRDRDRAGG